MKSYQVNGRMYEQTRKSEIKVNAGGGGLDDATEIFGAKEVTAIQTNFAAFGKYIVEAGRQEAAVFEKGGKMYERTGFQHFNGHFSGYTEGVYEVSFREIR